MKHVLAVLLGLIFLPLVLALLFLMPTEFLIASWHLGRASATTSGVVGRSEITTNRGNSRSDVEYSYRVNGHDYTSTRVRAGLISNHGFEAGGGNFAREHPVGGIVPVQYDPAQPAFAMVEYGWPKWSLGFSLIVWGLALGARFRITTLRRRWQTLGYALARAVPAVGFVTLAVMKPTIAPDEMRTVGLLYGGAVLVTLCYANLKWRPFGKRTCAPE